GPVDVRSHHQGALPLLDQVLGELARRRCFPGALQPDHHHPGYLPLRLVIEADVHRAHQRLQLVVADLHEVIAGRDLDPPPALVGDGRLYSLADRLLPHARYEFLHHVEGDVRLQQRDADVAQRLVHHLGGDFALTGEAVLCGPETFSDCLQHRKDLYQPQPADRPLLLAVRLIGNAEPWTSRRVAYGRGARSR